MDPEFANVCFWYIPPSLRNEERDENFAERLHKVKKLNFFLDDENYLII